MAVYDKDGSQVAGVYSKEGTALTQAYDVAGNPLMSSFTAMTFNIQRWGGLNGNTALIGGIFSKYSPNIVGLQECGNNGTGGYVPETFAYGQVAAGATNPTGIMSQIPFTDFTSHTFTARYGEQRGYSKCYFTFNGKTVAWFNTHIEYYETLNDSRYPSHVAQMREIFEAVHAEDTFILTGDFNVLCKDKTDQAYTDTIKQFADAGYNMANWTDETGFVDTWFSGSTVAGSAQKYPCDNIITSADIGILGIEYDPDKLTAGGTIDHIPLIAHLMI